jgi:Ca-activated chloride channel family protein
LTLDHDSLSRLLAQTSVGMAGPNTALGDAVGLGLKLLDQAHEANKVLILLTDGNDTSSAITPAHAAAMAAAHGVTVHTIGIGDPSADGEAKVDLDTLKQIAQTTGGQFLQANSSAALQKAYGLLDQLTPHDVQRVSHQPRRDLFQWPLGLALGLSLAYHAAALIGSRVALARLPEDS